jgi:hypothetical protein
MFLLCSLLTCEKMFQSEVKVRIGELCTYVRTYVGVWELNCHKLWDLACMHVHMYTVHTYVRKYFLCSTVRTLYLGWRTDYRHHRIHIVISLILQRDIL